MVSSETYIAQLLSESTDYHHRPIYRPPSSVGCSRAPSAGVRGASACPACAIRPWSSRMTDATHRERVDQDIYLGLNKLAVLLDDFDRRLFASSGLSGRQFWALSHLDERHGRPMAELARL